MRRPALVGTLLASVLAACQGPTYTAPPASTSTSTTPASSPAITPASSPAPSASPGFAFDPESVVGYYQTVGYTCGERQPSTQARGFEFQSCQLTDPAGRTRTVGFTTDLEDNLADALMSIRGADAEPILDPAAVLDPFAGFLGAVLGEAHGSETLPWLASHLGDAYASTTLGELTIATYTDSPESHDKLSVEIGNRAYLEAPRPSGSAGPAAS